MTNERDYRIEVLLNHIRREAQRDQLAAIEARLRDGSNLPSEVDAAFERFFSEVRTKAQDEAVRGSFIAAAVAGVTLAFLDLPFFFVLLAILGLSLPTIAPWLTLAIAFVVVAGELLLGALIARSAGSAKAARGLAASFATPVLLAFASFGGWLAYANW